VIALRKLRARLRVGREDRSYHRRAARMGIAYDPERIHTRVDAKALRDARERGDLRIFAAVRHHNWEGHNLIPALAELGEVTHFDWGALGFPAGGSWTPSERARMDAGMLARLDDALEKGPVHLFFGYLSGRQVTAETIRAVRARGCVAVNLSLDDRATFRGRRIRGGRSGVAGIAPAFDLCCTSTHAACEKYLVEGANPLFLPEGANPAVYRPVDVPFDHDVSFVGQHYGNRPAVLAALARRGIEVAAYGPGWPRGALSMDDMVAMYSRSRINLGFGGVGPGDDFVCLKGRDFEVPMAGGLYLTRYNPELQRVYDVGNEIVCYRDVDDLAAQIKALLADPARAETIRRAGHARARRDHTWRRRMDEILARLIGPA